MICPHCHGTGWVWVELPQSQPLVLPCYECIGGVASCCDGVGNAYSEKFFRTGKVESPDQPVTLKRQPFNG